MMPSAPALGTSTVLSNCTLLSLAKTVGRLQAATLIPMNSLLKSITSGWVNGFPGMLIFSGSLPATRMAVMDFDPVFLTVARAAIAGLVAAGVLLILNQKRPGRAELVPLLLVALGVVIGFPLLTALALQNATAAHAPRVWRVTPAGNACVTAGCRPCAYCHRHTRRRCRLFLRI